MEKYVQKIITLVGFRIFLILVLFITGLIQFTMMIGEVKEDTYKISLGDVAQETITATKTIEDKVKTEANKQIARDSVAPIYDFNSEIAVQRASLAGIYFDIMLEARKEMDDKELSESDKIKLLNAKLKDLPEEMSAMELSEDQQHAVINSSVSALEGMKQQVIAIIENALKEPIKEEQLNSKKNEVDILLANNGNVITQLKSVASTIAREAIVETQIINEQKTELARKQAVEEVESTKILQGQIIVRKGGIVDQEVYRQLDLLGVNDGKVSIRPIIAIVVLITIQMSFLYAIFIRSSISENQRVKNVCIASMVFILSIFLMKLFTLVSGNFNVQIAFLFPTAMAALLIRLLTNERTANIVTVLIAASAGIMFQDSYASVLQMEVSLYILFGGFAAVLFMRSVEKRSHILQASSIIIVLNVAFIIFYLLMTQTEYKFSEVCFYIIAGIVSGLLSAMLTMGLLPFFESMFGILSTLRLIELSNPNHPLLKKLLNETPGTYHHSVMVGNLAEAACEAVGADGLLARVGCYYHDVGKMRRPQFFIENQMGINPHDSLPAESSADIIIAHTTEGAEMLKQYKLPREIIDIALQHHGSSLLKFFYIKAQEEGLTVDEKRYRYPGPKPRTKEAAIISVADSVEAAVRSMKEPNMEKIRSLVQAIIRDRVQDNQFDECDISLRELKKIEAVMCETLNGMFHTRIEYPKDALKVPEKEKVLS